MANKLKNIDSKKKRYWEVMLPVPFVLSESITDEMIISRLSEVTDEDEVSSIFSSALQIPSEGYVVNSTLGEILEMLVPEDPALEMEVQDYDTVYLLLVKDAKTGKIIGRGEISEARSRIKPDILKQIVLEDMKNFRNRFETGQKRMNNLAYTLKSISRKMYDNHNHRTQKPGMN